MLDFSSDILIFEEEAIDINLLIEIERRVEFLYVAWSINDVYRPRDENELLTNISIVNNALKLNK